MSEDAEKADFPVVGLGASAGGIGALRDFFRQMPADSGMAFVVIMHLDPGHSSQLAHVLSAHTAMPVVDAEQGMPVERDRVHVIPANAKLSVADGHFRLEAIDPQRATRRPVDHFFASLALMYGDWAIAAVLSGTGSNGSAGIARIKERGGLVAVQDPSTAEYSGMPSHAVGTGLADLVLPVNELPGALLDYVRHDRSFVDGAPATPKPEEGEVFDRLLDLLHRRTGHEFRCYKDATIIRRIRRRMGLHRTGRVSDYLDLVQKDSEELAALMRDLLITVTSFFRDPDAWETLRTQAVAPLIADFSSSDTVRAWVPGCASGEEAYSLAMLLFEEVEKAGRALSFTLFATDASERSLSIGRHGVYPASVVEELSQERIDTFFLKEDDTYRVRPKLRDSVIFAPQNLLQDPPFSHMHLISCRNVLIYLKPDFQQKVVALFHFALRPEGVLFLGNVETPVGNNGLFDPVSKRWRIYRRRGQTRHDIIDFPVIPRSRNPRPDPKEEGPPARGAPRDPSEMARRVLLNRYAPPSVLVDSTLRVRYFHGETGPFLQHPQGEPTDDLLQLLRDGLQMPVRTVVQAAQESGSSRSGEARVQHQGRNAQIIVTAMPLGASGDSLLISFGSPPGRATDEAETPGADEGPEAGDRQLQDDLLATREQLRMTVRQLEASNEDLKASNEEIMSMNEELQSSNEELESSKEELQSLNEELNTVNSQLESKVRELESKTNDLNNLINSSAIVTLFLDADLCIRWVTPATRDLFSFTPSDIGRSVTAFAHHFEDPDFMDDARLVLRDLQPRQAEVLGPEDRWYLRRTQPYRTEDDRIAGIVITFVEITEQRRTMARLHESERRLWRAVDAANLGVFEWVKDSDLPHWLNTRMFEIFGLHPDQAPVGREMFLREVLHPDDAGHFAEVLDSALKSGERFNAACRIRRLDDGSLRWIEYFGLSEEAAEGRPARLIGFVADITERRQEQEQLAEARDRNQALVHEMNHRVKNSLATVQAIAWQTLHQVDSLEAFERAFFDRLQSLARCHDVLVKSGWHSAELSQLMAETLGPHLRADHDEIVDECGGLRLKPAAAQGITMMLHELATNAAKYGALSTESGRLSVRCRVRDRESDTRLALIWDESGGPPARPPKQKGFGLRLIEGTVKNELKGTISFDYREEGLRVEAEFVLK